MNQKISIKKYFFEYIQTGIKDEIESQFDVYHTKPDLPQNEQIWSVGFSVKDALKDKEKYEKVGLKVLRIPKTKGIMYKIV